MRPRRAAGGGRMRRVVAAVLASVVLSGFVVAVPAAAAEGNGSTAPIAPFRFTAMEGYVRFDYWRDAIQISEGSQTTQSDLQVQPFLMTHSYFYHPTLLTLDLGFGPIFERATYDTGSATYSSTDTLYDLTARATVLKDKPYRGSVFYDHLNPTLLVAPGEVLIQETTRYGFDFSLLSPLTPMPTTVEAWRTRNEGRSAERVVDDAIDQLNVRSSRSFGATGDSRFNYSGIRQDSASGSPSLPIQASALTSHALSLDSQLWLGAARKWLLVNPINYITQEYRLAGGQTLDTDALNAALDLRESQSTVLTKWVRYGINSMKQDDFSTNVQTLGGGVTYMPNPDFTATAGVGGEVGRATDVDSVRYGFDGSVRYQRPVSVGKLAFGYGLLFGQRDQEANTPTGTVLGERVTLTGTAVQPLTRERVVPGSVVINNATRTQTYVEGVDYLLSVVGLRTNVQRIASGAILSGETVLVDYRYDTGGTFAYRQLNNSVDLGWYLGSIASVRTRFLDAQQSLTSGQPTNPLNSVRSWLVAAQFDLPLNGPSDLYVGGLAEWEDHEETIAPYRRQSYSAYLQATIPRVSWIGARVGARFARVDYADFASADVDLSAYDLWAWANMPFGLELLLNVATEQDTGGPMTRRYDYATLKGSWRVRRVLMSLSGSYSVDEQGSFSKRRGYTRFQVRRDF
jgi:hypothetical protein